MSSSVIQSEAPVYQSQEEKEQVTVELRIVLNFRSGKLNYSASSRLKSDNNYNPEERLLTIEQQMSQNGASFEIDDVSDADVCYIETIDLKEDASESNVKILISAIQNAIVKHATLPHKLTVKFFILTYSAVNFVATYLFWQAINGMSKSISTMVDFGKSTIEFCQLIANKVTGIVKSVSAKTDGEKEEPNELDAKISALLSHYAYFYLDWLEAKIFKRYVFWGEPQQEYKKHIDAIKLPKESKEEKKSFGETFVDAATAILGFVGQTVKNALLNSPGHRGLIEHAKEYITGGERRVIERVVNRLVEIAKVVGKTEKHTKEVIEIINGIINDCVVCNRPLGFYETYERFGYWKYLKDSSNDVIEEAKKWYVSNPLLVYENDFKKNNTTETRRGVEVSLNFITFASQKKSLFGKKNSREELFIEAEQTICNKKGESRKEKLYYNTMLKHGMGQFSGYGGALFVRVDENGENNKACPTKFVYVNKGTDVNSFNDWVFADVLQAFTGFSFQHLHAVKNAITLHKLVCEKYPGLPLFFAGHSLGGGLSSSCAIATPSRHAITFNAAGLNFMGSCWTRLAGALSNFSYECLRPLAIAERVHPIRIGGEAIDELMIIAKGLTMNMNERAYGRTALVFDSVDLGVVAKHGINNFLYKNVLSECRIVNHKKDDNFIMSLFGREKHVDIQEAVNGIPVKKIPKYKYNATISNTYVNKGDFTFKSDSRLTLKEMKRMLDDEKDLIESLNSNDKKIA